MDKFHHIDTPPSLFIHLNTHSFITPTNNTLTSSRCSSPHRILVATRAPSPPSATTTSSGANELIDMSYGTTHGGEVMFDLAIDDLLDFSANVELDVNVMDTCSSITHDPTCHNILTTTTTTLATTTNFTNPSYTHINTCASTHYNSTSTTTNKFANPSTSPTTSSSSSIYPPIISDSINGDYIITPSVPSLIISDKLPFNNHHQTMGPGIGMGGGGVDELCVPCEDMAELEWLSNFVEESFSSCGHHHQNTNTNTNTNTSTSTNSNTNTNVNTNAKANANTNTIINTNANAITNHHQHDHGITIHYNYDPSFQSTSPISVLEHTTPPTDAPPPPAAAACLLYKNPRIARPGNMSVSPAFVRLENVPLGGRAARSKRRRPNAAGPDNADPVCFWNTRILSPEASESILESPNSSTTTTSYDHTPHHDSPNVFSYDHDGCDTNDEDENDDYHDDGDDGDGGDDDGCDDGDDDKLWPKKTLTKYTLHKGKKPKKLDTRPFHTVPHVDPRIVRPKKSPKMLLREDSDSSTHHGDPGQAVAARKCLHCATQKTPQWRAGPLGPKTLCNACGVRYKSGRLCPEYRPASSPTFIETVHSNSHRKVVEMRRQKGVPVSNMNPLA